MIRANIKQYRFYWRLWRWYIKVESLLWATKHGLLLIADAIKLRIKGHSWIADRELDKIGGN